MQDRAHACTHAEGQEERAPQAGAFHPVLPLHPADTHMHSVATATVAASRSPPPARVGRTRYQLKLVRLSACLAPPHLTPWLHASGAHPFTDTTAATAPSDPSSAGAAGHWNLRIAERCGATVIGSNTFGGAMVLSAHLARCYPAGHWRGKRVLELGAGTGALAAVVAALGAHVVATDRANGPPRPRTPSTSTSTTHHCGHSRVGQRMPVDGGSDLAKRLPASQRRKGVSCLCGARAATVGLDLIQINAELNAELIGTHLLAHSTTGPLASLCQRLGTLRGANVSTWH